MSISEFHSSNFASVAGDRDIANVDRGSFAPPLRGGLVGEAPLEAPLQELVPILTNIKETAYRWTFDDDRLDWAEGARDVLGIARVRAIATGSAFQTHIGLESAGARRAAILEATKAKGADPGYCLQYRFLPKGRRDGLSAWVEDLGYIEFGPDGEAVAACGAIRVIGARRLEELRRDFQCLNDELTGQMNRSRLTKAIDSALAEATHAESMIGFLLVGINNLALINEVFGFEAGDEAISKVGATLKGELREGDIVGRFSANKFGILLNECDADSMGLVAKRLINRVREQNLSAPGPASVSLSIGGIALPQHAETSAKVMTRVLEALEAAKHQRHDAYVAYAPNARRESTRRRNLTIADEITSALRNRNMKIALQPIVCARTHRPVLYECLLRMETPNGTLTSAGEFIEVAEQLGLSPLIDNHVLELTVELAKASPQLHLSLNISGLTASSNAWLTRLREFTECDRAITERLTIEFTETAAIHDLDESIALVDSLKELGCRVAIDDFGAGYTSFRNLKLLGVDMVKIDGSFVRNLPREEDNRVFIESLVNIARHFDMETVAEWVRDKETCEILADLGITHLQGFYFGQPILADEFFAIPQEPAIATGALAATG